MEEQIKCLKELIKQQEVIIQSLKVTASLQVQISRLGGKLDENW